MTRERLTIDEMYDIRQRVPQVEEVAVVTIAGRQMIHLDAMMMDQRVRTYVEAGTGDSIRRRIMEEMHEGDPERITPDTVIDAVMEGIERIVGVEGVRLDATRAKTAPELTATIPGVGPVRMVVDQFADFDAWLKRISRERRQDAEGRTLRRLGAISLALVATGPEDLDRIVDTVFIGGNGDYRGVKTTVTRDTVLTTSVEVQGVRIRSDGIEIGDLPETVKVAMRGGMFSGKPLGSLIEIPGFEDLRIAAVNGRATANRTVVGGAGWMRVDVRDADGALLDDLLIDEARDVARETFEKRRSRQATT